MTAFQWRMIAVPPANCKAQWLSRGMSLNFDLLGGLPLLPTTFRNKTGVGVFIRTMRNCRCWWLQEDSVSTLFPSFHDHVMFIYSIFSLWSA